MFFVAQCADDIYTTEPISPFNVFDNGTPRGTGVFTPQTGVYTAFININAFV
jgi:hypothetical protein